MVRGGTVTVADTYIPSADLLKNKSRPEAAAEGAAAWVISERELREKLKKEREAKERELEKEVRIANRLSPISDRLSDYLYAFRRRKERKRKARQRKPRLRLRPRPRKKRPRQLTR